MFRKRDIELIILNVLGCQDENDRISLKFLMENDESFCWKELGECQNLSALFPSVIRINKPSEETKEIFVGKLNRLIFGKEDISHTEKFVHGKKAVDETILEKVSAQNKIDWGSLSSADSALKTLSGFEEVKTKITSRKDEIIHSHEFERVTNIRETTKNNYSDFKHDEKVKESSSLRKYVFVSVLLFVVIVSMTVYMFVIKKPEEPQIVEESKPLDTAVTKMEKFQFDSLKGVAPAIEIRDNQKVETKNNTTEEQTALPKAPPIIPDQLETPIITAQQVLEEEEYKIEEQISVPPPQEVREETEQTEQVTFFVAVEEMPQPIGGLKEIQGKIHYPEIAKRVGIQGKVFIKAFVDEEGIVVNAEIVKGIGGGCDEAALDAVLKTKFTPGKQRGKPVKVQVTVPVQFIL